MKRRSRLAFILPALLFATPALASPAEQTEGLAPLHFVTLDRMIHEFAERAHASRASHRRSVHARAERRQRTYAQR